MRLDHLLSKENRAERKNRSDSKTPVQLKEERLSGKRTVETLAIALFNFEGTVRSGTLKRKDQPALANGGVAQLGEHLLCKQGVRGSIPLISTKNGPIAQPVRAHA